MTKRNGSERRKARRRALNLLYAVLVGAAIFLWIVAIASIYNNWRS